MPYASRCSRWRCVERAATPALPCLQCLEQYDLVGATVIGTVLLFISLALMLGVNFLQKLNSRFRKLS